MPAGPDLSTSQPACAICPSPRTRRQAGAPKTQGGAPAPHRRRPPSELVTKHPGAPCRSPGPRKSQRVVRMASTFLFHFPAGPRAMTDLMSCNFCFPRQQRLRQLKRQKSQGTQRPPERPATPLPGLPPASLRCQAVPGMAPPPGARHTARHECTAGRSEPGGGRGASGEV